MNTFITVKRPSGIVEEVEFKSKFNITKESFHKVQEATKNAGKGDVLSFRKESTTKTNTSAIGWCNKCHSYCFGDCQS